MLLIVVRRGYFIAIIIIIIIMIIITITTIPKQAPMSLLTQLLLTRPLSLEGSAEPGGSLLTD